MTRRNLIVVLCWILASSFTCFTNKLPAMKSHPALLDGGFWQMGGWMLKDWSDEKLAREVKYMNDLGMNIIIIQYGAYWNTDKHEYISIYPQDIVQPDPALQKRDPVGVILDAADKLKMHVLLGDILIAEDWPKHSQERLNEWVSPKMMRFRKSLLHHYGKHSSFYGIYIPNEPNPRLFSENHIPVQNWILATQTVAHYYHAQNPGLKIVHSIGLYNEPITKEGKTFYTPPSISYLDDFWRSWIREITDVDIWMVIDGIGTGLSNLDNTDEAQAWCAHLAHEYGKEYWTDVENAVMGNKGYHSFPMSRLEKSLDVAAKHGTKLVTFDYIHYMSRQSPKPAARKLYKDYQHYYRQQKSINESNTTK